MELKAEIPAEQTPSQPQDLTPQNSALPEKKRSLFSRFQKSKLSQRHPSAGVPTANQTRKKSGNCPAQTHCSLSEDQPDAVAVENNVTSDLQNSPSGTKTRKSTFPETPISFFQWLYNLSYRIGTDILRFCSHLLRRCRSFLHTSICSVSQQYHKRRARFLQEWDSFSHSTLYPYREISRQTGLLRRELALAKEQKCSVRPIWKRYFSRLNHLLNHIASFVTPIIGFTVLVACLSHFTGLTYGLSVEFSGQNLGCIANESVYYAAQDTVIERLMDEDYLDPENIGLTFQLTIVNKEDLLDEETLANRILVASGSEVENADGVYINEAFVGALRNGQELLVYLNSMLDSYRTGTEHEVIQFIDNISIKNGIYPTASILNLGEVRDIINSDEPLETIDTSLAEDTLGTIAARNGITVEQLINLNPQLEADLTLYEEEYSSTSRYNQANYSPAEGTELLVSSVNPNLGVQITRRETYTESIPFGTTYIDNSSYYEGWTSPISAGVKGQRSVVADVTYIDGEKVSENRISTEVISEPVNARVSRGTKKIVQVISPGQDISDSYIWPVEGGWFNGSLNSYAGHTGMDIAAPFGTVIRASRAGTVIYATNVSIWPYGKSVVIQHDDGARTRYAHCSKVVVSYGQYVQQGEYIGQVGSTGNSSGNHCHFEIIVGGQFMWPERFIGYYYPGW